MRDYENERMRGVISRRRMRAQSETGRHGGEIVINSEEWERNAERVVVSRDTLSKLIKNKQQ